MNNKLTIGGVVFLHAVAILLLTSVGGCRTAGTMDRNNDTAAYSGFPREANGSGYVATARPAAPVARPVEPAPADVPVAEPVAPAPAPVEPTAEKHVTAKPVTESKPAGAGRTYTVKKNDYLGSIARREGVTTAALAEANGLKKNATLREGQKLVIPAATEAKSPAAGSAVTAKKPAAEVASGDVYVVKKGDVLSIIARKHGTTSAAIRTENNLKSDSLREGQKLRLPSGAAKKAEQPAVTNGKAAAAPVAAPVATPVKSGATAAPVASPVSGLKPLTPLGGGSPAAAPVSAAPAASPVKAEPEAVEVAK